MESFLAAGLFKAVDRALGRGLGDSEGLLTGLLLRVLRKDKRSRRELAFKVAFEGARAAAIKSSSNPTRVNEILRLLDSRADRRIVDAFAEEAAKLPLLSRDPDVPRLAELCYRTLRFDSILAEGGDVPSLNETEQVLHDFLPSLWDGLLDQDEFSERIPQEMVRSLREISSTQARR